METDGNFVEKADDSILCARPKDWIRLGCAYCDRDDFDFISNLPTDWHRVSPVQKWEEAIQPPKGDEGDYLAWETHAGVCPECFVRELNDGREITLKHPRHENGAVGDSPKDWIRLGCAYCDRRDSDGIPRLPTDWYCLSPVEMVRDMIRRLSEEDGDLLTWETHLGVCPECIQIHNGHDFRDRPFRSRKRSG